MPQSVNDHLNRSAVFVRDMRILQLHCEAIKADMDARMPVPVYIIPPEWQQ